MAAGPACASCRISILIQAAQRLCCQCGGCRYQCSLLTGTVFESSKVPLTSWFLAMHLMTQAKNNVSALELERHLGVPYPTAWLLKHKIMEGLRISVRRGVADDHRHFVQTRKDGRAKRHGTEVQKVPPMRIDGMHHQRHEDATHANVGSQFIELGLREPRARVGGVGSGACADRAAVRVGAEEGPQRQVGCPPRSRGRGRPTGAIDPQRPSLPSGSQPGSCRTSDR